jgi:D-beta-D-heptose 7-phosphate kinase / D-beta-D-heptose 1-phosphate adenosyltransferase
MTGPLVVLGDSLLDIDLEGTAERLAPDGPVPVLDDLVEHARPGGAALAAAMAARSGVDVVLLTAWGDDAAGSRLGELLAGVRVEAVGTREATPVKKRVRAAGQSLLRLDSGGRGGAVEVRRGAGLEALADAGAVLVADYGGGITDLEHLREAVQRASGEVPVVWDPHPRGAAPVRGSHLVTPNRQEARAFAAAVRGGPDPGLRGLAAVHDDALVLLRHWRARSVAVTMGSTGALLAHGSGVPVVEPARRVQATDPCGAGDRLAVTATLALRAGQVTTEAVQAGVRDATDYVEAGGPRSLRDAPRGPAPVGALETATAVARRGGTVVATGGCFDLLHAGHVATLRAARELGDCLVVLVNGDASVRRLKGPTRPLVPAADRVRVLEALECVDAVLVFDDDTPVEALRAIRPQVWVKGGDYAGAEVPESQVLGEWGGQAVALPYLPGRSTTGLVRAVVGGTPAAGGPTSSPGSASTAPGDPRHDVPSDIQSRIPSQKETTS